ncbi:MAG: ECF transporter S component [Oscillospiraceae bacterium]|nr:ECF transporter S component [Oscillospiraceae bacterium]
MEETKTKKSSGWNSNKTFTVVGMGLMTAIVVVLQLFASGIHVGPFSITLALAPIVIGAAIFGWKAGGWLGFVFSVVVLFQPDTQTFMAFSIPATIAVVLIKGTVAGLVAGLVYNAVSKKNKLAAVITAGIASPVVNSGIFAIGCFAFFIPIVENLSALLGYEDVVATVFLGLIGLNFLVELGINLVLASAIVMIINVVTKRIMKNPS